MPGQLGSQPLGTISLANVPYDACCGTPQLYTIFVAQYVVNLVQDQWPHTGRAFLFWAWRAADLLCVAACITCGSITVVHHFPFFLIDICRLVSMLHYYSIASYFAGYTLETGTRQKTTQCVPMPQTPHGVVVSRDRRHGALRPKPILSPCSLGRCTAQWKGTLLCHCPNWPLEGVCCG